MSLEALIAEARVRLGGGAEVVSFAPGRINLIGEHTDYIGGLAMPAAIDGWVVMAARRRSDRVVALFSAAFGEELRIDLSEMPARPKGWLAYVGGALALFSEWVGGLETGFDAVIVSDVPLGAGLSSSAALECAVLNGLAALYNQSLDARALIRMAQAVEHRFLGVHSGLLDQMASQLGRAGQALVVDFRDLSWRYVAADLPGWRWVVVDTGVRRELASSAYEARVASCREGLAALGVGHWRDLLLEDVRGTALWAPFLRHGVTENTRVLAAAEALAAGDADKIGKLLIASHQSLRDDYAVSCSELDLLAETAWTLSGCAGARMMGGGFGGCTINLVRADRVEGFTQGISAAFRARFGRDAPAWAVQLVGGAGVYRLQESNPC